MTLDIEDKNYISEQLNTGLQSVKSEFVIKFDQQFDRISKHIDQRFDHYFGILQEDFNHKFSILTEIGKDKPNREEVREIARDEAKYIVRDEISKIGKLKLANS